MKSFKKTRVVLVGIYLEGIYPRGDKSVEANLLAPAMLKSAALADDYIRINYQIDILNVPSSWDHNRITKSILDLEPDAVGFSVYIWNAECAFNCSLSVHNNSPNTILFFGGPEVSHNPKMIIESYPFIDMIVSGSGEIRFKQLLKSNFFPQVNPTLSGITYRDTDNNIVQTHNNGFEDLLQCPSPYSNGIINLDDGKQHCVFIETFRGCIFKCGYCMWMGEKSDKKLDLFPIEQVLDDIEIIYNNPNVRSVVFTDACIFYTHERAKIIFEKIAHCKYKIPTILTLDIAFMDEQAVESLKNLDLSHQKFLFGMQSINQETMRLMHRRIGPKIFKKRIELIRSVDPEAEVSFDLIYGLPGDSYLTFRETLDFALNLSPIKLNMAPLVLLPGSTYWVEKEHHQFVYDSNPPYLVHSNRTYSSDDMKKTRQLVLGIIMVMYFPLVRDALYFLTERSSEIYAKQTVNNNNFSQNPTLINSHIKRIDVVELLIQKFELRSFISIKQICSNGNSHSIQAQNDLKKMLMDQVSNPHNCLIMYESLRDILIQNNRQDLISMIHPGLEYYQNVTVNPLPGLELDLTSKYGCQTMMNAKFGWIRSSDSTIDDAITHTKNGGIGSMC